MVRADREQYRKTLEGIKNLCNRIAEDMDENLRNEILTNCQQAAITLGESLEACSNPTDVEAIGECGIIGKLEAFCEQIYKCANEADTRNITLLRAMISEIKLLVENMPRTYRIVFLPYKAAMWDSLESIWRCFAADKLCETSVVPIPYFEANRQINQWDTCYDGELFPKDVPVVNFQDYLLGDKKPDVAFVHNPFDRVNNVTTVHPAYYSEELKKHCGKLIYVPYYVNPGFLSGDYNELPLLYRSDHIVLQSERMKETCRNFPYYDRVLPFGSPKFDKIIKMHRDNITPPPEWNVDLTGKKRLLLNTTLTDFLESGEKLMDKLRHFFEMVSDMENVVIIWRPHPLLKGTVKAMRPQFIDKFQELVDFFNNNNVGVYDTTADVSRAIAVSDAYIGSHYSSIIGLFEVLNKPVFRFDSKNVYDPSAVPDRVRANPLDVFKMRGEFDFFGCYECNEYMFEDFVDDLVNERLGEVLALQAVEEAGISNNLDGTCGQKVYEYIMKELCIYECGNCT